MADLASGYNIVERIGTGAQSVIFQVVDPKTGAIYALKKVRRERHHDNRFLEQAITEYEISSQTDHQYLRKSFEIKKIRAWHFGLQEVQVVMEYVRGVSLEQHRPPDIATVVDVFLKVAEGLDHLHSTGYLHADIKPNNILVCLDGSVKIIDFGQGCKVGFRKPRIQGTPDYIAPEQVQRRPLTQKTDIFNLGATLYWALTGRNYPTMISKKLPQGVINVAAPRAVPTPQDLNEAVPASLSRLVMECCHKLPHQRPKDMRQVICRLEAVHHVLHKRQATSEAVAPSQTADGDL